MKHLIWILVAAIPLLPACNRGGVPDKDTATAGIITIAADSSLQYLLDQEVFVFQNHYKYATILTEYYRGEDAYEALRGDSIRLVVGYREATPSDSAWFLNRKLQPRTNMIGADAMVLICSKMRNDSVCTVSELRKLFTGDSASVARSGQKLIFDHPRSTVARMFLNKIGIRDGKPNGTFALNSIREVIDYVSADTNAIGVIPYISMLSDTSIPGSGTKVMAVADSSEADAVLPDVKTIGKRTYPLVLGIYILSKEARSGLGTGFTAFITEDKGQRIILRSGLSPAYMPPQPVNVYGTY